MASEMTFRELFDHLAVYMADKEQRWKHVMRVKRGLRDPSQQGGYGNDQCYFEGKLLFFLSVALHFIHGMQSNVCIAINVVSVKKETASKWLWSHWKIFKGWTILVNNRTYQL